MMDARAALIMALADGPPLEFAGSAVSANSAAVVSKPVGVEAGDLVFVWVVDGDTPGNMGVVTTSGSGWANLETSELGGAVNILCWKVLNATDVANAWNIVGGTANHGAIALRYRSHGADTVTVRGNVGGTDGVNGNAALTGFTKAPGTYGTLSFFAIRGPAASPTPPTGFTVRQTSAASGFRIVAADNLYEYVDGAAVIWSAINSTGSNLGWRAILLEITGP